jgi:hypothetical protein
LISLANDDKDRNVETRTVVPSENVEGLIQLARPQGINAIRLSAMDHVHGSPPFSRTTKPMDRFIRFNAFAKDRRVLPGGGLVSGTYATSLSDASVVPNAFCAVGRYALPNPVPPIYKSEITTHAAARLLAGTCAPLFGQAGGGAEVEFSTALPTGSVATPSRIAEL